MLLFLILARLQVLQPNTVEKTMKRLPKGLVLVSSKNPTCQPCQRLASIFETLATEFNGKIAFGLAEVETCSNYISSLNIAILPTIAVYVKGLFVKILDTDYSEENLRAYCQNLVSPPINEIHTLAEYYNFSSQTPSNIVIFDPKKSGIQRGAVRAVSDYGVESHIGIIKNSTIATILGKSSSNSFVEINRPFEGVSQHSQDFSTAEFIRFATSNVRFLDSPEMFGMSTSADSVLTALYDKRDPYHQYEINRVFAHVYQTHGKKIAFQVCDYFNCPLQSETFNALDTNLPTLLITSKTQGGRTEPYPAKAIKFDRLDRWINAAAFGIRDANADEEEKPEDDEVPYLLGSNFQNLALDPKFDVIIFVGSPTMKMYHSSREQFKKLMKIFGVIKGTKFFEFNPKIQHVMGLQLPKSDNPLISIWPAQAEPNGGTLPATAPLNLIVENAITLIKSPINQQTMQKMQEVMQEQMQQR
ncbi:hypothetical protein TRFO_16912 [Tritrichomonas foetus]|uniref:Thioredoxin domain-containing protein n=1 Tax=Tritrichomonas foetus TaxID=1144522 RepID=A0A1J4KNV0_9EUKA|nr:hypothetical protein TRFO_16912 [Tritrichomonas foetus]|eukprot:OHT12967.1 hypothetical protein TRFO_16912 [Tritrichomonas foetus]